MRRFVGLALVAMMMACGITARAEDGEFDPAKVSESLKAIFQFGSTATKQAADRAKLTKICKLDDGRQSSPCLIALLNLTM